LNDIVNQVGKRRPAAMKIAFVVNELKSEVAEYTTTRLAMAAVNLGHQSYTFGVGDFVYAGDGSVHARAHTVSGKSYKSLEKFLKDLQANGSNEQLISLDELDVLLLRNDPSADASERPWAASAGVLFGELVARRGVMVLNDPSHLTHALNKTYFQHFPDEVRPRTCISRHVDEIKRFIDQEDGRVVIKPLQGSGGKNVFLIGDDQRANLNQMIDAVLRDGYCVAQEYLPAATEGDVRLFVMNGEPLQHEGKYAAFRRVNKSGDARSNMHSGGQSEPVEVTDEMLRLVEIVRPKLVADGMYLVGLDIVQDKLIEINVFSPGGLGSASHFAEVDFPKMVIEDLERKVEYRKYYGDRMNNVEMATL
jgi:glutathione synthase